MFIQNSGGLLGNKLLAPADSAGAGFPKGPSSPYAATSVLPDAGKVSGAEVLLVRQLGNKIDNTGAHELALTVVEVAQGKKNLTARERASLRAEIAQIDPELASTFDKMGGPFPNNAWLLNLEGLFAGRNPDFEARMWRCWEAALNVVPNHTPTLYNMAAKTCKGGDRYGLTLLRNSIVNAEKNGIPPENMQKLANGDPSANPIQKPDPDFAKFREDPEYLRLVSPQFLAKLRPDAPFDVTA
jgi:hypothetical protein